MNGCLTRLCLLTGVIAMTSTSHGAVPEAQKNATPTSDAAQQTALKLHYADTNQCFIAGANDTVLPVLPLLVESSVRGVDNKRIISAIDAALARGCDIHQPDAHGLSPLNLALVLGNVELTRHLLTHHADPTRHIHSDNPELDNLDSSGLLQRLARHNPEQNATWQTLQTLLQQHATSDDSTN